MRNLEADLHDLRDAVVRRSVAVLAETAGLLFALAESDQDRDRVKLLQKAIGRVELVVQDLAEMYGLEGD